MQFNFTDTVTYYQVPPNSESCESYSQNLVVQLTQVRSMCQFAEAVWRIGEDEMRNRTSRALAS